ncbi:LysR family transcriptional regulator, partial [Vibrio parahaemolyticus]|nr:LysR family transcriptional regulator [Vibrio parahaemolyticus]
MDFNLIQTFLIVAEYQSYSRAAEHLETTPQTLNPSLNTSDTETNTSLLVTDVAQSKLT